ncbi:photosystem I protein PsaX [Gloeocapsopsis crepidinum LEGE 06123]|uniref:Photosystem I protein PsaX n=1 Tax=Gloeocapsopsis crepidinum LEGE 06123 TaxID=588587 RepID=A0ABR9UWF3_9CHRO|nr:MULTISPECIES: photosystem I protein PsaX [Gloeocapsopsis]MBE9192622.1 photosystem I protein PsaX [Gloeocapsopsis crepidinum LEGE 06123]PIG91166.1 photosystem one PsaX [Gloeocapsopsis sp. IPPAS B-1203]
MTAQATKDATIKTGNPPYPYRTIISLILLAGNFLIAAIYFRVINP